MEEQDKTKWDGKSKGTVLGYRIFLFSIRTFGVSVAYFVLRFVSFYYFLFAKKNKEAVIDFYRNALSLSEKVAKKTARKNFYTFGQTLIDRMAFLVGRGKKFTHTFENEQFLLDIRDHGKGGVLLSGHVGNWETAGNLLKSRVTSRINVLMYDEEVQKIKKFLESQTGGSHFNIIPIRNDMSHVIKVHNALSNNEFVAIHADRFMDGSRFTEIEFFGRKAKFPLGPFIIASKFNAPVTFVFAIKSTSYHYHLSATPPIYEKRSPEEIAEAFAKELENKVRKHPEQWFNYFNFYQ